MSTYSNLAIELIGTGEQDGTWGTTTNVNLGTALEEAIVGTVDQAVTASNLTLTLSNSNATQVARHLRLRLTGSAGGASNLIVPELSGGKNYYIINASNTAVTVKTSADGILVPAGKSMALYQTGVHSGTNYEVVEAANYSNSYTILSADINGGTIDATTIGAGTPSTGAFTTLAASGAVSGAGVTARFATPGPIGNTSPSTGAFTALSGISTGSVPSLEAKGTSGVTSGYLELNCSENSHAIKLLGPPHSATADYTLTFPNNNGDADQFLQTDGSGVMSWAGAAILNNYSTFVNSTELITISATNATGTINYDTGTQSVVYYTAAATGDWTVNFRHSSGATLNSKMATGEAITLVHLVTLTGSEYRNTTVQVDGSTKTPEWQGGAAPTEGNINSIDSYTYTIIKTGDAAFTVLAALVQFA